jgi:NAD-dependent DNA ligase
VKVKKATAYKMKVCFTKIRDHEFEKYLMSQGIGVANDVTREVAYLIAGSMTSSKVAKASKLGIPIIDMETAYKKFGYSK